MKTESAYKYLCMVCVSRQGADMLTGYCLHAEECDGCEHIRDLALTIPKKLG